MGLFADLGGVDGDLSRLYLEGDERVFLDHEAYPSRWGTGVEDFFSGGFYFDRGPIHLATHGMAYQMASPAGDATGAIRLMLADAIPFERAIHAELETGPEGDTPMRARTVAFVYRRWPQEDTGTASPR